MIEYLHVLKQLKALVTSYRLADQNLPQNRDIAKDFEFVKHVIRKYASPTTLTKFKSVEIRKPGKPLRLKRSLSLACKDDDCKGQATEKDFQNLENEAQELMKELEMEYSQMWENLKTIDQKILDNTPKN